MVHLIIKMKTKCGMISFKKAERGESLEQDCPYLPDSKSLAGGWDVAAS